LYKDFMKINRKNRNMRSVRWCRTDDSVSIWALIHLTITFLFLLAATMPSTVCAGESPVIDQIVLKTDRDEPIKPEAAGSTADGGFVIAGSAGSAAWSAKLDEKGETLWQYRTGFREDFPYPVPQAAEFRGVASMPDGTTFLCGNIPRPRDSGLPSALLTHLDSEGKKIDERLIVPQGGLKATRSLASFDACATWDNGVVVIGKVFVLIKPGDAKDLPITQNYYWITAFDTTGKMKWERFVPFRFDFLSVFVSRDVSVLGTKSTLLFSVSDTKNTDLLSIDTHGDVTAQRRFSGYFKLIHSVENDLIIQLWGITATSQQPSLQPTLVTLDAALQETRRVTANPADGFVSGTTYRLSDNSLVSFGKGMHLIGRRDRGEAIQVSQELKLLRRFDLEQDDIDDTGQIWVATPTATPTEFMVAKVAISRKFETQSTENAADSQSFKRGASIQFVKFR